MINFNKMHSDDRDRGTQYFENLVDTVQEAFTCEKVNKAHNNIFLEFLGDGVLSMFLAWDLVIRTMNNKSTDDIDSMRIQNSSAKKLYEICVADRFKLYEYMTVPLYKVLEFFVYPIFKINDFIQFRFAERREYFDEVTSAISKFSSFI